MGRNKRLYYDYVPYEIVANTWCKIPIFTDESACFSLRKTIWKIQKKYKFFIYCYSIAPCHLNIIFKPVFAKHISSIMRDIQVDAYYRIYELIDAGKLMEYEYLCGKQCYCKLFKYPTGQSKYVLTNKSARGSDNFARGSVPPCYTRYFRSEGKLKSFRQISEHITHLENFIKYRKLWDTGFYDQYIRNEYLLKKKIRYIYYNNQKHHLDEQHNRLFKKYRFISPNYKSLII